MKDKRNVIESTSTFLVTKKELINLINESFPDDEVGNYGNVGFISTTKMTDEKEMQTICLGKILKI